MPFLRPDADQTDGTWVNASGNNTNLYDSINETVASDADFIRSSSDPANDIVTLRLSDPGSTPQQPAIVRARIKKVGTATLSVAVRLIEGTGPGTVIAEWAYDDIADSFVDVDETLTTPEFSAISDFSDLYLQFEATVGTFTPLLLDTYPGALFAHSFRKLSSAYTGSAARIRRSSDNAEQDIGFSGVNFDTTSAASFIGGGTGFITTLYDQSGNGFNITMATAGSQPTYVAAGINGTLPTAQLDGSTDELTYGGFDYYTTYTTSVMTILSVMRQDGTDAQGTLVNWGVGGGFVAYTTYDNVLYLDIGSGGAGGRISAAQPSGWDDTDHIVELWRDGSDSQNITVDGTNLVSATRGDDMVTDNRAYRWGDIDNHTYFTGYIAEQILWPSDLGSGGRAGVRTDMNTYYSVF